MSNRFFSVIAASLAAVALVSSCAPAAAPTPSPKPPAAPPKVETPPAKPAVAPAAPSPSPKAAPDQPKYGGSLGLPSQYDPPNLDIHTNNAIMLFAQAGTIYSGLLQYDQKNKVIPDLAERWEISPDAKVYILALRKGVKWHDGKPFTSADAKLSLERIAGYTGLKYITEAVDKIEMPDDNTLKITLKYPQAGFLSLLGHGRALIGPKHIIEAKKDLKQDAIGTGPFKLKEYIAGVSFRVEKSRDYYIKDRPYLDTVTFYYMRDAATRFASFRTGRALIFGHPPTHNELLRTGADIIKKSLPQVVMRPYHPLQGYGLVPNWNRAPWNDVRVRRAAFLAVDREQGIEVISEGVATLGVSFFPGEWALPREEMMNMPGFRKPREQDIAEAKRLLAEAGYPQGFKSTMLVRTAVPLHEKAGTFMKDQLARIGIDMTLQIIEYAVFVDLRTKVNYDTMMAASTLGLEDPDVAGRNISYKLGGGETANGDDPGILELYARQTEAKSVEERKKIVFELQRRIADVVPHIFIGWQDSFIAFWPEVKNYTADSGVFGHNKLEEIWLSK